MKARNSFFIILILTSFFLFVILIPKLSIRLFPLFRQNQFNQFKNYLLTASDFNPQIFWRFREFYCPGYFVFNRQGIDFYGALSGFKYFLRTANDLNLAFAQYNCRYLNSLEFLTEKETLFDLLNKEKVSQKSNIIRQTKEFIFFQEKKSGNYYIIFLLNGEKMKKAVGFFDYQEKDRELTRKKNWFDITLLKNN